MGKFDLTPEDIQDGINRLLADAYSSATISSNPTLAYITAGPGAGKTSIEVYIKKEFREKGEKAYIINSDKIAEFHPNYEEALDELPGECYRITRQFVRPAAPKVFEGLIKNKINIINENTLDKGESDIELAKKFRENGYRILVYVLATDIFESRLSCFEREAAMLRAELSPRGCTKELQLKMYNSFVPEVQKLDRLGYIDDIRVYVRGENIQTPPVLKYKKGDSRYSDFNEALIAERDIQRKKLLSNPTEYILRIQEAKRTISEFGINPVITQNALDGLDELQEDFLIELAKEENSKQVNKDE